jgi:hypothetical protein
MPDDYFSDDELDRRSCLRLLQALETGTELRGLHAVMLDFGIMSLPLYVQDEFQRDLVARTGLAISEIYDLQDRVNDSYPSRFAVLAGIRSIDPRFVRVVNYDTPFGKGWYAEASHEGRWLRPYDAVEFADHPDRRWLSGMLGRDDDWMKKMSAQLQQLLEARAQSRQIRASHGI